MQDQCDRCELEYDLVPDKDLLYVYLMSPTCNHVLATCPRCDRVTRIFMSPQSILAVMQDCRLFITLAESADDEVRKARFGLEQSDQLPELPRHWAIQLDSDIHKLETGSE